MITSKDIIEYSYEAFDNALYLKKQSERILSRLEKFPGGKLYLEIGGGKLLHDPHAARILPGFKPDNKIQILKSIKNFTEILFCLSAKDIEDERMLNSSGESYYDVVVNRLAKLHESSTIKPVVVIGLYPTGEASEKLANFKIAIQELGYKVVIKYEIANYPKQLDLIISEEGFGKDEYFKTNKSLIVVTGAASNSGKQSTCLSQLYLDQKNSINSGYSKFELFPIWNLPIDHPINLAYEAATADIGDFNVIDKFHLDFHNKKTTNYNRDVDSFPILKGIINRLVDKDNFMQDIHSPTDMGINSSGICITNDQECCHASTLEIDRRKQWYVELGEEEAIRKCAALKNIALKYMKERAYSTEDLLTQ